jgi:hypothetical protein
MININSDHGRIGMLWWINANTSIRRFHPGQAVHPAMEGLRFVQWGSCGLSTAVTLQLEVAP